MISLRPFFSCVWIRALLAGAAAAVPAGLHAADQSDRIMLQFAPGVVHYGSSADYHGTPWLLGAEYLRSDRYLLGYAYFNNSFDQRSHCIYGGRTWKVGSEATSYWYFKLTGGVIIGYREPYEDKIPFNHNGVAPGIVPGIGYQFGRFNAQVNVLGSAGLMFTFGYDLLEK